MVGVCLPLKNTIINCDYLSTLYMFAFRRSFDFQIVCRTNLKFFCYQFLDYFDMNKIFRYALLLGTKLSSAS